MMKLMNYSTYDQQYKQQGMSILEVSQKLEGFILGPSHPLKAFHEVLHL